MTTSTKQDQAPSSQPDVWTVQRVLTWSAGFLKERSKDLTSNPRLEAELLLAHVLDLDRMKLYLQLDRPLSKDERESFKTQLRRRGDGEPVAYIVGYRDFYRHRFQVSPSVLIPRPDTELLVELALRGIGDLESPRILDVGTGSGCVAISIAAERPQSSVTAWDISAEAVKLAHTNAQNLGVTNVTISCRNALLDLTSDVGSFDFIVSNPPYIAKHETKLMSFSTISFEPQLALFTSDDDGLQFYKFFAGNYHQLLSTGGKIFLEIGLQQGEKVAQLFEIAGWRKIEVTKDLSGHDRVISAERP